MFLFVFRIFIFTPRKFTMTKLKKLKVQHDDTLHLKYTLEADIDYFLSLIETLAGIMYVLHVCVVDKTSHGIPNTQEMHH